MVMYEVLQLHAVVFGQEQPVYFKTSISSRFHQSWNVCPLLPFYDPDVAYATTDQPKNAHAGAHTR